MIKLVFFIAIFTIVNAAGEDPQTAKQPNTKIIFPCLNENKELKKQVEALKKSEANLKVENKNLQTVNSDLQSTNNDLRSSIDGLNKANADLTEQLDEAQTAQTAAQNTIDSLQSENDNLKSTQDVLNNQVVSLTNLTDLLTSQVDFLGSSLDALKDENTNLKNDNQNFADSNNVLDIENQNLQTSVSTLTAGNFKLTAENRNLLQQLSKSCGEFYYDAIWRKRHLRHHWLYNGSTLDAAGKSDLITNSTAPVYTDNRKGKRDGAFRFQINKPSWQLPPDAYLANEYTILFWVRMTAAQPGEIFRLGTETSEPIILRYDEHLRLAIDTTKDEFEFGEILYPNIWYHVGFVQNSTHFTGYINGGQVALITVNNTLPSDQFIRFVNNFGSFTGDLESVKFFNAAFGLGDVYVEWKGQ